MAEVSYPFDGSAVDELAWFRMASMFAADGLRPGTPNVTLSSGLSFVVPVGFEAIVRGTRYSVESSALTKTEAVTNSNSNPRLDRLVLRWSAAANSVTAQIKRGTPGASPTLPALTQEAGVTWEIGIAYATCPGVASTQNYSNLVREPIWSDQGGFVEYNPTVTGFDTFGDSVPKGLYKLALDGLLYLQGSIVGGTGVSMGSGAIKVSLPVGLSMRAPGNLGTWHGRGQHRPVGGAAWAPLDLDLAGSELVLYATHPTTGKLVNPGVVPLEFASGSAFNWSAWGEPA
ncbi:hypothetical protein [Saccharothrix stipae]